MLRLHTVGCVVMGKLASSGEQVAIKYHSICGYRNDSFELLRRFEQHPEVGRRSQRVMLQPKLCFVLGNACSLHNALACPKHL